MDFLELSKLVKTNFRVSTLKEPSRYKRIYIPIEQFYNLLRGEVSSDLPGDCEVLAVGASEDHYAIYLILYHESWAEVQPGHMIPELLVTWSYSSQPKSKKSK